MNTPHKFPVIEVFGPTMQGEGALAGQVSHFVRFAGCSYRCSWCDSMVAVDPKLIKENRTFMEARMIGRLVQSLGPAPWITLTGGDPCSHPKMEEVISELRLVEDPPQVAIETQGAIYAPWLMYCDFVTLSPKPPSSGMDTNWALLKNLVSRLVAWSTKFCLKVVVFDDEDFNYALKVAWDFPATPFYITVGTKRNMDLASATHDVLDRWRWLANEVMNSTLRDRRNVTVFPQMHILIGVR